MSYTELYLVPEKGEIQLYKGFHNSHRGAMLVWMNMSKEFLKKDFPIFEDAQDVWDLYKSPFVPRYLQLVMMSTFDSVMVKREDLIYLADCFDQYANHYDDYGHLPEQAKALRELADNPECFAVCWNQTSVSADTWWVRNETDEHRMYDISKDTDRHWFLSVDKND